MINNLILDRNRQRRMVFYGRVSTEHEQQLDALENQMQWYDDQLKYHLNWILQEKYIDRGITGTQAKKRPAFLNMMEDAKNGKFDLIVTREVCRFARNTVDTLVSTRMLKDYGVEVYFVEDNIWTMDGDGELRLTLMATLAQEESRKISERVRAGQKISRDNGVLYGNGNILGYDRVNGTYVINEEQAETVRIIYDLYIKGLGEKKISNELCKMKRLDACGNVKWSVSKINRILRNSTYKGQMAYGKSYSNNYLEQKRIGNHDETSYLYKKGDFEAIISEDDWDRVQGIRKSKAIQVNVDGKNKIKGKRIAEDVWLRKLRCRCGSSYRKNKWRTNKKSGEEVYGYQCYNQVNNGSKDFRKKNGLDTEGYCDIRMIGDWKLDLMAKLVLESIWTNNKETVIEAYKMISDCYIQDDLPKKKDATVINYKMKKLEKKIDGLIDMRAEGEITKEEYNRKRNQLETELQSLRNEMNSFNDIKVDRENVEKKLDAIRQALNEYIDFSGNRISDDVIDQYVKMVKPKNDKLFQWYLDLVNSDDEPLICGVEGNKKQPVIIDRYKNRLAFNQSSTGSAQQS